MDGSYDEALLRFHRTGPEFNGWLSNHGPMAVDALLHLDQGEGIHRWVDGYLGRLDELPRPRWPIAESDWRDPLGDASRLGDWLEFFDRQLDQAPWRTVLATWWPRLLPGAIASATHPLIRTGHVVRALLDQENQPRLHELGQALGYWAARWAPLPPAPPARPGGRMTPASAFSCLPAVPDRGGARTRVAALFDEPAWAACVSRGFTASEPRDVIPALDGLVDAAVSHYAHWAPAEPVMLVHMATAPRAARLVLPALPPTLWPSTYAAAWRVSAAIAAMYRPSDPTHTWASQPNIRASEPQDNVLQGAAGLEAADVAQLAAEHGDEHVIKFTEVALESHRRGNPDAIAAIRAGMRQIS